MGDTYYQPSRRRVFPAGTPTEELRFTVTTDEAIRLRKKCRVHDVALSSLVVRAALAPSRALTVQEKAGLMHELIGARRDIAELKRAVDKAAGQGEMNEDTARVLVDSLRLLNTRLFDATEGLV